MGEQRIGTTRALRRVALASVLLLTVVPATSGPTYAADPPNKPAPCVTGDTDQYCVHTLPYATVQGPSVVLPGQTVTVVFAPTIPRCRRGQETTYPAPCWLAATLNAVQGEATFPPLITPVDCNIPPGPAPYYCVFTVPATPAPSAWIKWSVSMSYFEVGESPDIQELYGTQHVVRKNALIETPVYYGGGVSADFRYDIDGGLVSFHSKSRDGKNLPLFETWDFGDGKTGTGAKPEHRYTRSGTYSVRLTAKNTDQDEGTITRTVQVEAEPLSIEDVVVDPSPLVVGDPGTIAFTVVNNGDDPVTAIVPVVTFDPTDQVAVADDTDLVSFDLAGGATKAFVLPVDSTKAGETFLHIGATGVLDGVPTDATPASLAFDVAGNPGLTIQLDGQIVQIGKSFTVKMTITNPTDDAIDGIAWTGPNGIVVESGDNPPAAEPNVSYVSGPDAALPTSLEAGASAAVSYLYNAPTVGASVFTVTASGTARATGEPIQTVQAMTAIAVANWSEQIRDQVAKQGLMQVLTAIVDGRGQLANASADQVIAALGLVAPSPQALDGAASAGISDPALQRLVGSAATTPSTEPGFIRSVSDDFVGGFAEGMNDFGTAGGQQLYSMYDALADPVQRQAIADAMWTTAKELPEASLQNAGYLGKAYLAAHTIDGLQTSYNAAASVTVDVANAMVEAGDGIVPVLAEYGVQAITDPTKARHDLVKFLGGVTWKGSEAGMTTAVGEAGTAALLKVAVPVARTTLSVFKSGGQVAEEVVAAGSVLAGEEAAEAMILRQQQAARVVDNFQALPADTVLDAATVTGKGGLLAEDAEHVQSVIRAAEEKFGVELVVSVRTSEPLSAGLDGIAKPEYIKPKAVSVLDQMLGAEPARAGKVGMFDPVPLADSTVLELEAANPGFAAKYYERLAAQQKLWKEWKTPGNALETLTNAGAKYKDTGGITVLLARPNNPVPFGLQYLEQLGEEEFLLAKGIDPADVPQIRRDILSSNIAKSKAAPIATVGPNGTVYVDDALSGKPYLSDADIHSVGPKDGIYPPGVSRGQVVTEFKAELSKLKRFPFHGWSDAAFDLPSDYYLAAVPFQLGNANPATAFKAANTIAGRLQLLETLARQKAAKLLAAGEGYLGNKILDRLVGLNKFKDPITGLYSAEKLLKAFPPGEKTINFTAGDIRVGYGTGGS